MTLKQARRFVTPVFVVLAGSILSASGLPEEKVCEAPGARKLRLAEQGIKPPKQVIPPSYEAGEITRKCENILSDVGGRIDEIAKLSVSSRTTDNTLLALEFAFGDLWDLTNPLTFMAYVST